MWRPQDRDGSVVGKMKIEEASSTIPPIDTTKPMVANST
jgi:hypothetical protein